MNLFYLNYESSLEISNGLGFCLSIVLLIAISGLLINRVRERMQMPRQVVTLAIGMILVKISLAINFGYRWVVRRCEEGYITSCPYLDELALLPLVSVLLLAAGFIVILHTLTPYKWRPWLCIAATAISVLIPVIFYTFFGGGK